MSKPSEYVWIKRWGKHLGSFDYYIQNQQALAAEENAPVDAIYKDDDGNWRRIGQVTNIHTRISMMTNYRNEIPDEWIANG